MTQYVVLQRLELPATQAEYADERWAVQAHVDARTPEVAIRDYLSENQEGGTFAAVPARHFNPVTVEVEQTIKVQIVAADGS